MSHIERQRQLQQEEAGEHLFANRVRVYPKSVTGPVRRFKWAVLIGCLGLYYLLPWLRWERGVKQPNQAVLLDLNHPLIFSRVIPIGWGRTPSSHYPDSG